MSSKSYLPIVKPPLPDEPRPQRSKKDKKKWCGGHEGREHEFEWKGATAIGRGWYRAVGRRDVPAYKDEPEHEVCKHCGKLRGYRSHHRQGFKCAVCKKYPVAPGQTRRRWRYSTDRPQPDWRCGCTDKEMRDLALLLE